MKPWVVLIYFRAILGSQQGKCPLPALDLGVLSWDWFLIFLLRTQSETRSRELPLRGEVLQTTACTALG